MKYIIVLWNFSCLMCSIARCHCACWMARRPRYTISAIQKKIVFLDDFRVRKKITLYLEDEILYMTIHDLPQSTSSDPSLQSASPSHRQLIWIQFPLPHLNWREPHSTDLAANKSRSQQRVYFLEFIIVLKLIKSTYTSLVTRRLFRKHKSYENRSSLLPFRYGASIPVIQYRYTLQTLGSVL